MSVLDAIKNMRLSQLYGQPQPSSQEQNPMQPQMDMPDYRPQPTRPTSMQQGPMDMELTPVGGRTKLMNPNTAGGDEDLELYNRMYTPETTGIDKMTELIGNYPRRENPSKMRKIFGGIAAVLGGGPTAYNTITQGPYEQKLADWKSEFEPVQLLANQERYENANERLGAQSLVTNQRMTRNADTTAANVAERNRQTAARTALEQWKAMNPNIRPEADRTGRLFVRKPDGKIEYLLGPTGEPILGKDLTPEQIQQNRLALLDDAQAAALTLAGVNNAADASMNDADNAAAAARNAATNATSVQTAGIRAAAGGADGLSPSQQKVQAYNKAQELFNRKPEYREWIMLGDLGTNEFTVRSPEAMLDAVGGDIKVAASIYSDLIELLIGPKQADAIRRNYGIQKALGPVGNNPQAQLPLAASIPLAQRVAGQTMAKLPTGAIVRWNGQGWEPVQ